MKKVFILSQFDYQTFPIVEGMIDVSKEDLDQIGITKCFDVENQCVIDYDPSEEKADQEEEEPSESDGE